MKILDLSTKQCVKGARHWHREIDQLYHPTGEIRQDSCDIVYAFNNLNTTKFVPILIKEWFYLVKKDGYLVIDYLPNSVCNFQELEKQLWWLWLGKYDIVYHGHVKRADLNLTVEKLVNYLKNPTSQREMAKEDGTYLRLVCKKIASTEVFGDSIDKWSFGIITKGERDEWIEEIIQSIHQQNIPNYEIIVCGTYRERKEKNFIYIPFQDRDDRGWITKKKNLIAKSAKYENLCVVHDRIVFSNNWYKGVKKYGNVFELMCVRQTLRGTEMRTGDWVTYGSNILDLPYDISTLDYKDWDEQIYVGGMLTILKRHIAIECPWDETRYWGEEDVELTFRQRGRGYLPRFNPYCATEALSWRFGVLPAKYYLAEGILPKDMLLRRIMRKINKLLFYNLTLRRILWPVALKFTRTSTYRFLISR